MHAFSKTEFPASLQLGFHPCFLTVIARSMPITIDCIHSSIKEFGNVPNPYSYTFNKLQFYQKYYFHFANFYLRTARNANCFFKRKFIQGTIPSEHLIDVPNTFLCQKQFGLQLENWILLYQALNYRCNISPHTLVKIICPFVELSWILTQGSKLIEL